MGCRGRQGASHWVLPVLAGLFGPSACCGQETIAFDIRFSDRVLTPGETQEIEVWAIMSPDVGQSLGPSSGYPNPALVVGFAAATFDLVNDLNGETGAFAGLALNPALSGMGTAPVGIPDGRGNVLGAQPGQFHPPFLVSAANPIMLWRAEWTPSDYSPRAVQFSTRSTAGPWVWIHAGWMGYVADPWEPIHSPASFAVVPAPGALLVFWSAASYVLRRRGGGAAERCARGPSSFRPIVRPRQIPGVGTPSTLLPP